MSCRYVRPWYWTEILGDQCSWKFMFLVFRFLLQMRPYFPTEVEGKDISSKLMVMVGVYMCYNVLICRIQVIRQTYVTFMLFLKYPIIVPYFFQNEPKNPKFVPYFLLEKSHIFFKMSSGQPAIKKSMLHAIIRYMQKKIESPPPKSSTLYWGGGGGVKPCKFYTNTP